MSFSRQFALSHVLPSFAVPVALALGFSACSIEVNSGDDETTDRGDGDGDTSGDGDGAEGASNSDNDPACGVPDGLDPVPERQALIEAAQCSLNAAADILRDCGIGSGDTYRVYRDVEYYDGCSYECLAQHLTCESASVNYCGAGEASADLDACLDACDDGFACADGSGENVERCDGDVGCDDGSDEEDCGIWISSCDDGSSYPTPYRCDGEEDCADGSDEAGCPGEASCDDGGKIPASYVCDSEEDCADGSDEVGCGERVFSCKDGSGLVLWDYVCDEDPDCEDGSDEAEDCFVLTCD